MQSPPTRLGQPVLAWAQITPDAPALSEPGRNWSFAQLAGAVDEAASLLRERGVRRGDRVMVIGENSLALAAFIFAAGQLDTTAVLENARRAPLEVDTIRAHCEPRCVVYTVDVSPDALAHAQRHGAESRDLGSIGHIAVGTTMTDAVPDPVSDSADDVAVLIYTTGTTGAPKGVMLTHANLLYLAQMMRKLRRLTAGDRVYGVLPITHVMGLAGVFCGTLSAGAHLHLAARFSAAQCLQQLAEQRSTMLQGAPAMFAKLADQGRRHPVGPLSLRFIAAGGAPIDATVKADTEAFFGLTLHNGYGLTEGSGLSWTRLDQPRSDCSVGLPLPGVEFKLLEPGGTAPAEGPIGELWARGPNVMKGYYRNPELTTQLLQNGGWFNTQDLARIDADGYLHIEGRTKDLIIVSGFNVYPLEIEQVLNAHPGVLQSAVVGRPSAGSEDVIAFVEPAAGHDLELAALQAFLAERLSPYKRPREIWLMSSLPTAPNGKLLKNQLKALTQFGIGDAATRLS
ncbi:MAG: acyl--CoA ligase [Pseudomonadota bacterium]|nr:acyl--CoA ligase [Pseudomonadota bacterium]